MAVLTLSGLALQVVARLLGWHFQKEAVPLKRPLAQMDRDKLLPEYRWDDRPIEPLSEDVIQTLGTSEYLNWHVLDCSRPDTDPVYMASLFITYYTGKPDMIPHVPDQCYAAGGFDQVGLPKTESVEVHDVDAPNNKLPIRVVSFEAPRTQWSNRIVGGQPRTVLYFFYINGRYATTRDEARLILSLSPRDRYAYYAKVEMSFTDYTGLRNASREESLAAAGPLLQKIMPLLLKDHLQDWKTLTAPPAADARPAAAGPS